MAPRAPPARNGTNGTDGATGATGATAPTAPMGLTAPPAPPARTGPAGPTGATGATARTELTARLAPRVQRAPRNGTNGIDGADGATGATGPRAPPAPPELRASTAPTAPMGLTAPPAPPARRARPAPPVQRARPTAPMAPTAPRGDGATGATGPIGPQGPSAVVVGGAAQDIKQTAHRFFSLFNPAAGNAETTESLAQQEMTVAGTLSQLRVRLSAAAGGAGSSYAFTVRKGGRQHECYVHRQRGRKLLFGHLELGVVRSWQSDLGLGGPSRRHSQLTTSRFAGRRSMCRKADGEIAEAMGSVPEGALPSPLFSRPGNDQPGPWLLTKR